MPQLESIARTIKSISDNFDNDKDPVERNKSNDYAKRLGLSTKDLMEYRNASVDPEDPQSIKVRNAVFDKVASKLPVKEQRGVLWTERLKIKNFIDENPALQKKYLDEKGYQTRIVDNRVQVKKPGDPYFKVVDPEGLDWTDLALEVGDIGFDVLKGLGETAALGAKAVGALTAPLTGGASIAASAGLGAAAGAGTEAIRQVAGMAAGVRPGLDVGLIGQEAALGGTIGGTLKGLGEAALKYGAKEKASTLAKQAWRKGAETLEKSWETMGGTMTPALKFANEGLRKLEDAVIKSSTSFFHLTRKLQRDYANNAKVWGEGLFNALDNASKSMFGLGIREIENAPEMIGREADKVAVSVLNTVMGAKQGAAAKLIPEVGEDIRKTIMDKLTPKLAKASELYDEVDAALGSMELIPKKKSIYNAIKSLRPSEITEGLGSDLNKWLDLAKSTVDEIKTVKGLDELSTQLLDAIETGSKSVRAAAKVIRSNVLDARAQTYSDKILDIIKNAKDSADPIAKKAAAYWEDIYTKRKTADKLYKELNDDITAIAKRPGEKSSRAFSAKEKLDTLAKTSPEEIFKKVASENDVEKMRWVAEKFPDEYKQVVGQQLGKIWLEVAQTRKDIRDVVLREFKKLTDSQKLAMLGSKANEKITNLADIMNKASDKIAVSEWLNSLQKKVKLDDEFGQSVINALKNKTADERKMIFGNDDINKVEAIINIGGFRKVLASPSGTPEGLRYFQPKFYWQKAKDIMNEYQLLKQYKEEVLKPEMAGKKATAIGEKLLKPSTFGKIEAARSITTTPQRGENE